MRPDELIPVSGRIPFETYELVRGMPKVIVWGCFKAVRKTEFVERD